MNGRLKGGSFLRDDGGVALTEFCIVIPVVLLFFLAMLQYLIIAETSQLCSYAAYVAARSYAVRAKADQQPDGYAPQDAARYSAAMALAPAARLVTGGSGALGTGLSALQGIMGGGDFSSFTYGFAVAYDILQGVNFSAGLVNVGSHTQSIATINYPQQINVPGFASLWNFSLSKTPTGPYHNISTDLQGLATGTNSGYLPGQQGNLTYGGQWSALTSSGSYVNNGYWNWNYYISYSYDEVINGSIFQVNENWDEHYIWVETSPMGWGGAVEWTWEYTGTTYSTTTDYVGQYVNPNALPVVNIFSQAATGCEEWSGVMKQANSNPDKWQ